MMTTRRPRWYCRMNALLQQWRERCRWAEEHGGSEFCPPRNMERCTLASCRIALLPAVLPMHALHPRSPHGRPAPRLCTEPYSMTCGACSVQRPALIRCVKLGLAACKELGGDGGTEREDTACVGARASEGECMAICSVLAGRQQAVSNETEAHPWHAPAHLPPLDAGVAPVTLPPHQPGPRPASQSGTFRCPANSLACSPRFGNSLLA